MFELKVIKDQRVESDLYKGVALVLKPITTTLRAEIELACAKDRARIFDFQLELRSIKAKLDPWITANLPKDGDDLPKDTPIPDELRDCARRLMEIQEQMAVIRNGMIYPLWIRRATKTIEGVSTKEVDTFVEYAPPDMLKELGEKIFALAYMDDEAQENLESPTTTSGVDGGQNPDTSVTPASPESNTSSAIVQDTFQKAFNAPVSSTLPVLVTPTPTSAT